MWKTAMEDIVGKTRQNLERQGALFPHIAKDASKGKHYLWEGNTDWIEGFYTGIVWLCYEYTGDARFKEAAEAQVEDFRKRLEQDAYLDHHDIGFLYTPSAMADWMVNRNGEAYVLALKAAEKLMKRWRPKGGYIQAWGPEGDPQNGGRIIIDCLMNLPLLYWASLQTGDARYHETAVRQADLSRRFLVRGDDSSFHTFYFDQENGEPLRGGTHQGYRDGSTWTRGQAWGIYGFALSYRYTRDVRYLETSRRMARYFIERLPEDGVVYWDFDVQQDADTPRDSSACAIAVCGMLELMEHLQPDDPDRAFYEENVQRIMQALHENCSTVGEPDAEGFLKRGSYYVRGNRGLDDYMIWGDYYYMEALMRLSKGRPGYWYE